MSGRGSHEYKWSLTKGKCKKLSVESQLRRKKRRENHRETEEESMKNPEE